VKENQAMYPIHTMCRLLEVSARGYYAWLERSPSMRSRSDTTLLARIRQIHAYSKGTYGMPRIQAELARQGIHVGGKRVARLMQEAGLRGVSRRRWIITTQRQERVRPAPDLVQRHFHSDQPNRLWVADATYIPTVAGFLYLAVVLDVFSRRIVGWSMAAYLRTELMLAALDMALLQRRPRMVIHHSDQGCQYTSLAFGQRCSKMGVRPSMGTVGDCFDNAMCESFFATLECELLARHRFQTREEAQTAVFEFIEGWYNTSRLHSSIGYLSPNEFERKHRLSQHRLPTVPPPPASEGAGRGPVDNPAQH